MVSKAPYFVLMPTKKEPIQSIGYYFIQSEKEEQILYIYAKFIGIRENTSPIVNKSTFNALFNQNYPKLCNHAFKIVRDRASAEDIVQEVFLKFWRNREGLQIQTTPESYLFRATTNASLNHLKKHARLVNDETELMKHADSSPGPGAAMNQKELESAVKAAMESLPPQCRTIFVLNRYEGKKYKEIAELLGISFHTVKNQMTIALGKLREELGDFLKK